MSNFKDHSKELIEQNLKTLGGTPYVYHCHHFNLFHDQTVEDALGQVEAFTVRSRAAQKMATQLIGNLIQGSGASNPVERLQLAKALFAWMGQGGLDLLVDENGGKARGDALHYSFAWREKYGSKVKRNAPIDAFAAGFAAAATELAFDLPTGSLASSESACFACREPFCDMDVTSAGGDTPALGKVSVDEDVILKHVVQPGTGMEEARIAQITQGLNEFLLGVEGDQRGLVQGFGIFITRHLSGYYDQTAYDTIHMIEKTAPQATGAVEELFGESGHVCVFNTFGNLLLSPEWEGMVGPVRGEVEEIVTSCAAIARALGFGHWTVEELKPGERLVMRSTSNYEFPFYLENYGKSDKSRCYFFANASRAFMQLAHRVDWPSKPELTQDLYQELFKGNVGWHTEETLCRCKGDECCEVVVTRK